MSDWRDELMGEYVLHSTGVIGKVEVIHPPNTWWNKDIPESAGPVTHHVIEFDSGHAFLAGDESAFRKLNKTEVALFTVTKLAMVNLVKEVATWAKSHKLDMGMAADVIAFVCTEQARQLMNVSTSEEEANPPSSGV